MQIWMIYEAIGEKQCNSKKVFNYMMNVVNKKLSMETVAQAKFFWTRRPTQDALKLNLMAGIQTLTMHEHKKKKKTEVKKRFKTKKI